MEESTLNMFKLEAFLNNSQEAFHIARTCIASSLDLKLHSHDYAEVFWIKEGSGIHIINNHHIPVCKGMLCMVRPEDQHTFKNDKGKDQLVITNIAFSKQSLNYFRERYFPHSQSYFWTKSELPYTINLNPNQLNDLSTSADALLCHTRDYMQLDFVLLKVFMLVSSIEKDQNHIPHWLAFALDNYNTPAQFQNGIQGFAALTDRSVDHVNRVLQKFLKQSLTETVIKSKLKYASQQLIMTNSSIKSICFDCGFSSVSYFHRLFKRYKGITPLEFRKKNHKIF
jgi:AraC family cel operon transcriptional repressor